MGPHARAGPATSAAPPCFSSGPDPLLMLLRKKLLPTSTRLVDPNASITLVGSAGGPITPSPLRSWWKLVSRDSNAGLDPDTMPIVSEAQLPLLSVLQTVY